MRTLLCTLAVITALAVATPAQAQDDQAAYVRIEDGMVTGYPAVINPLWSFPKPEGVSEDCILEAVREGSCNYTNRELTATHYGLLISHEWLNVASEVSFNSETGFRVTKGEETVKITSAGFIWTALFYGFFVVSFTLTAYLARSSVKRYVITASTLILAFFFLIGTPITSGTMTWKANGVVSFVIALTVLAVISYAINVVIKALSTARQAPDTA